MKKLKVAVIGCGRIAGHHCRNIHQNPNFTLVAVCDLDLKKAQVYGQEFSIPAYENYREMLRRHGDVDIVTIATPSGMHFSHAIEIISEYKKHVVVEKPTFLKLPHLAEAYARAHQSRVSVFPVFQNRYNLAVRRVQEALRSGELGDPRLITVRVRWCRPQRYYDLSAWRGTFAMDGGAITNQGVHHIDLLRTLGGDVDEVYALMRTLGADIEVEDTCVATLKFKSGAVGTLEITTAARPDDFEASISIVGEKGLAQIGGIAVNELQVFTPDPAQTKKHSEDFSSCVYGNGHRALYEEIAGHLLEGKKHPLTQDDCRQTLQLLHSFYASAEQGRAIRPADAVESARLGEFDEELVQLYTSPGLTK